MSEIHKYDLRTLSIAEVEFGNRAREVYDDLDKLSESIKQRGLISPLSVLATPDARKPYRLLAGGRRMSAMLSADITEFPAKVYTGELTELEMLEIELYENLHRRDLSWAEKVKLTNKIHQLRLESTVRQTAEIIGSTKSQVQRDLELSKGLNDFPELEEAGTETEARNLLQRLKRREVNKRISQELASQPADKTRLMNGYIRGDFFDLVASVPSNSVQFCEVDPPYAVGINTLRRNEGGAFKKDNFKNYKELDPSTYGDFLKQLAKECFRIMFPESWIVLWTGPQWYSQASEALQEVGFQVATLPAYWVKIKAGGQSQQPQMRLGSLVEPFLYANKGPARLANPGHANVFYAQGVPPQQRIAPTERPIELIQEILFTFAQPNSNVCVPFLGSGNTLLSAANLGMKGFGFDLDEDGSLKEGYVARVQASDPPKYRSLEK